MTAEKCPLCGAKPGTDCTNPLNHHKPLPGRRKHFATTEYPHEILHHYTAQEGLPCDG